MLFPSHRLSIWIHCYPGRIKRLRRSSLFCPRSPIRRIYISPNFISLTRIPHNHSKFVLFWDIIQYNTHVLYCASLQRMYPRTTLLHSRRHALSASPLRRFPNEVLGAAFSFLHRRDLTSVVRVCRCFHVEGQIFLYQSVELSNESPNVQETIALLRTLPVGAYVREVALITTGSHTPPAWFSPNIVQNWVNLRRLELSGIPFTSQDIHIFRAALQEHCRGLQSLVYRHDPWLDFPGDGSGLFGERRGSRGHSPG